MEAAQVTSIGRHLGPDIETLMAIERELADGDGSAYLERLCDDAVVVLPGRVLDKEGTATVMGRAPSWDGHDFRNGRLGPRPGT